MAAEKLRSCGGPNPAAGWGIAAFLPRGRWGLLLKYFARKTEHLEASSECGRSLCSLKCKRWPGLCLGLTPKGQGWRGPGLCVSSSPCPVLLCPYCKHPPAAPQTWLCLCPICGVWAVMGFNVPWDGDAGGSWCDGGARYRPGRRLLLSPSFLLDAGKHLSHEILLRLE